MAESIIEISEKRGHQQGREEGIEQGEIHAKQEALLKLLRHRFTSVPEARDKPGAGPAQPSRTRYPL